MKQFNSVLFYIVLTVSMFMVLNESSIYVTLFGLVIMFLILGQLKNSSKENVYELLGINWLQKKFNNSELIMDMTKE
jgi:Na+/H+ antiporter NhaA